MDETETPKPDWIRQEEERIKSRKAPLGHVPSSTHSATPSAAGTGTSPWVLGAEAGTHPARTKYSDEISTGLKKQTQEKVTTKKERKISTLKKLLGLD